MLVEVFVVWVELEVVDVDPLAVVTGISAVGLKKRWYIRHLRANYIWAGILTVNQYSLAKTTILSLPTCPELSLSMMCGSVQYGCVPA